MGVPVPSKMRNRDDVVPWSMAAVKVPRLMVTGGGGVASGTSTPDEALEEDRRELDHRFEPIEGPWGLGEAGAAAAAGVDCEAPMILSRRVREVE